MVDTHLEARSDCAVWADSSWLAVAALTKHLRVKDGLLPSPPARKGNYTTIYLAAEEFAIE